MPISNPAIGRQVVSGTYSGTGVDDRQITTGFKCSCVLLFASTGAVRYTWLIMPDGTARHDSSGDLTSVTDALLHATDGFVVDENMANNASYDPYDWWAISV